MRFLNKTFFYKRPLGEIAWIEPFLWDLITCLRLRDDQTQTAHGKKNSNPVSPVKGVVNSEKWLNRETFSIILELILNTRSVFIY